MSVNLEQAQEVFFKAVQLADPSAQEAYLQQACGDDHELRQHVENLLTAHGQSGSFLEKGALALDPTLEEPSLEQPGVQIGPYKLLQQIGEGGMGVVYMAEQTEPVRRKIALKIIKPGMDTKHVVARFEAERQALALMDHPNIARVFDAGATSTGRPYFVMELVRGVPLVEFCDQNALTTGERLELFIVVCRAVQHAHHRGVIHRDLKPSNILVTLHDNQPVPKVIDFGVSKAISQQLTEKTMFTAFGQMVGTPVYMSPEQAQMSGFDVDTRSDVYSLGVILYELLTGSTPITAEELRRSGYAEMQRLIREQEPPKPSLRLSTSTGDAQAKIAKDRKTDARHLGAVLHGDLDWIVMKAIEKDRTRRYDSANGFASDVERFLANEVIEARAPSLSYRVRKAVLRNRAAFMTAALVLCSLLIGLVTTSWQAWRATSERDRAEAALIEASQERQKAILQAKNAIEARKKAEAETHRADRLRHVSDVSRYASQLRLADPAFAGADDTEALAILKDTDPTLRGWEFERLQQRWQSRRHLYNVDAHFHCVAISSNGQLTAAGGAAGAVRLFDFESNRLIEEFKTSGAEVLTLRFSPNGQKLLAGTDTSAHIWDVRSLAELGRMTLPPHTRRPIEEVLRENQRKKPSVPGEQQPFLLPRQLPCLAFDKTGDKIAIATPESIQVWDSQLANKLSEAPYAAKEGQEVYIVDLDFHPDGERLAVKQAVKSSPNATPHDEYSLLDVATGKPAGSSGELNSNGFWQFNGTLQYHPSGQWLVTEELSFLSRALTVRDAKSFEMVRQLATGEGAVDLIRLSGDGSRFAFNTKGAVSVRDFGAGGLIASLSPPFPVSGAVRHITDLAISSDGRRIVASFGNRIRSQADLDSVERRSGEKLPEGVVGWDLRDSLTVREFTGTLPEGYHRTEAPGANLIVSPEEVDWFAHQLQYSRSALTEEPVAIASAVVFRSCRDGQVLFQLAESSFSGFFSFSISRDGKRMAVRQQGKMQLWDIPQRRRLPDVPHGFDQITNCQLSPSGKFLLIQGDTAGAREQVTWDLEAKRPLPETRVQLPSDDKTTRTTLHHLSFDSKGRQHARYFEVADVTGAPGRDAPILESRIEIVDTISGKIIATLHSPRGPVNQATFIDEGRSLCYSTQRVAKGDEGLWHWDLSLNQAARFHHCGGFRLQTSRDGKRLLLNEFDPDQIFRSKLSLFDCKTRQLVYQRQADQLSIFTFTGTDDILEFPMLKPARLLER